MAKKFEVGERVHIKSERGEGTARISGIDASGHYSVQYEKVAVDDGSGEKKTFENFPGHAPAESIVRRKGNG